MPPPSLTLRIAACCLPHTIVLQAQARDAAMQVQAAVLTAQNIHLRRELGSGWAAADPNIIQVGWCWWAAVSRDVDSSGLMLLGCHSQHSVKSGTACIAFAQRQRRADFRKP